MEGPKKGPDVNGEGENSQNRPRAVWCGLDLSVESGRYLPLGGDSENLYGGQSALTRPEAPKSQVHPRSDRPRCLRNRMREGALRLIPHDQQVTVAEIPAPSLPGRPMP
jgi:hypothetical protein